jgi:small-conductance mechanosensitive channel
MPEVLQTHNELIWQLFWVLVLLVGLLVLVRVGIRLAERYITSPDRLYRTNKLIRRVGALVGLGVVLVIFSPQQGDLLTLLTVIGAGLAIALREALLSVAGWLRIIFMTPFTPGDRIEINGVRGDVIDVRVLRTTLMEIGGWVQADQSTGRIVHIPNSWLFEHALFNYTRGFHFIWNEVSVVVSFRSDWETARDLMQAMAEETSGIAEQQAAQQIRELSREFLIHYSILTPFVYVRIVENGVRLTMRYLCDVRKRRGTEHALTLGILQAFRAHGGIELAYPMLGVATSDTSPFGPLPRRDAPMGGDSNTGFGV